MTWQERLLQEAEKIVKHGWGEAQFYVRPSGDNKTSILITAGETYRFLVKKE